MRQLARDPFARTTLVRVTVRRLAAGQTCSWCGNVGGSRRSHTSFLYRYGTESDAIRSRVTWHHGVFCAQSCHDAYHECD